jgi:hypothetical protein
MAPVRIVDVSYVAVPTAAALPREPMKLNAMEAQWVVLPLLQHLLFFEGDRLPPFDAVVQSLRSSLEATLAHFAPLAGKLHYLPDTGDVAIQLCSASDGGGVKFVVAECDADVGRLAGDEDHDVNTFERLVPEVDMAELPAPVLAVQATRLEGGGFALGVTVHHGVADARSLWRFVEAWAAACRGDALPAPPTFDRSLVRLPGGEERARRVLRKYAPTLPAVRACVCVPARLLILWQKQVLFLPNRSVMSVRYRRPCSRWSSETASASSAGRSPWTRGRSSASSSRS